MYGIAGVLPILPDKMPIILGTFGSLYLSAQSAGTVDWRQTTHEEEGACANFSEGSIHRPECEMRRTNPHSTIGATRCNSAGARRARSGRQWLIAKYLGSDGKPRTPSPSREQDESAATVCTLQRLPNKTSGARSTDCVSSGHLYSPAKGFDSSPRVQVLAHRCGW
jgi:hypothetical protein